MIFFVISEPELPLGRTLMIILINLFYSFINILFPLSWVYPVVIRPVLPRQV